MSARVSRPELFSCVKHFFRELANRSPLREACDKRNSESRSREEWYSRSRRPRTQTYTAIHTFAPERAAQNCRVNRARRRNARCTKNDSLVARWHAETQRRKPQFSFLVFLPSSFSSLSFLRSLSPSSVSGSASLSLSLDQLTSRARP